jgi:hypothetical protein
VGDGKLIPKLPPRCREDTILHGTKKNDDSFHKWLQLTIFENSSDVIDEVKARLCEDARAWCSTNEFRQEFKQKSIQYAIENVAKFVRGYREYGPEVLHEAIDVMYVQDVMES